MKIRTNKGVDLRLAGGLTENSPKVEVLPQIYAICPEDFPGFVPKAIVAAGDKVLTGSPLMHDKKHPDLNLVSPVSGTVRAVVRGERRRILRIEIEKDNAIADSVSFDTSDIRPDSLRTLLAKSGMLALMRQRPYDIVPDPAAKVRDIFISAYDSAPLAPAPVIPEGKKLENIRTAVKALASITEGKVYISYRSGYTFPAVEGAELVEVDGPHPAGNVGIQIANIKPINKGETVWTAGIDVVERIGRLLSDGKIDTRVSVALTGPEAVNPCIIKTVAGAAMAPLVAGHLADDGRHKRIISGNVLTGTATGNGDDAFLHAPYRQITIIAEGDDVDEFMGWASLSPDKMSIGRSFPFNFFKKLFRPDARLNGGRRALIVSGEYDKMIPMDILPEYLIKAILAKDIEQMEALGIYEVAPEDFALAEYADTSKLPLQKIVREGLDYLRKELE